MGLKVNLPEGCFGLDMADGSRYTANRDGRVEVSDTHASAIKAGYYGQSGLLVATEPFAMGTKRVRWCTTCQPHRRWNAWNDECPRCGTPTSEEQQ